jgi:hypothetical protein
MPRGKEYKRLLAAADALLDEHAKLMTEKNHDGAFHCSCELAILYREARDRADAERARKAPKSIPDLPLDYVDELAHAIFCSGEHCERCQSIKNYFDERERMKTVHNSN